MDNTFRLIFEDNYNNLCRTAFRILHEKESAREIVQEVFIELWKKGKWQQLESPKAYLYVAVYNRSINALQKRKRFLPDEAIPHLAAMDHHQLEQDELEKIIAIGIERLPVKCKKIFLLSREEELTYKDIASYLGLSVKTVERQMGIALKKLRNHLDIHWPR